MIGSSATRFEDELLISPALVAGALVALGAALTLISLLLGLSVRLVLFALLLYALAGALALLERRHPIAGRAFTIAVLVGLVYLVESWLAVPGALALLAVPMALAAALIGPSAALISAIGETGLLLITGQAGAGTPLPSTVVPLLLIWLLLGIYLALYQRERYLTGWSWQQYLSAQRLLEEARDRRAELRQALEDLESANLQLTRLNHLAQDLRHAAEEARRAKEEFVANVSHELRTPLNMIVGFCEMIMEAPASYGQVPPSLLADLAVVLRNSQHLSSLIDDVLDLSQIEAGRAVLSKEQVALSEIAEAATVAVRPLFDSKGIYLETDIQEDVVLFCDRTRIREVLLNLLINAGRFTEQGGVCVRAWREGDDAVISVADTGPGISPEDQARLFEPFQQLDGSIRRRYGGTGLGLNISKSFVQLHGGTMWVESEKGQGATFLFRLPITPPPPVSGGASRWLTPGWEHVQRTRQPLRSQAPLRRRLVVLEPGDSLRRLLERHLEDIEVVTVRTLEEAAAELERVPAQALLVNDLPVSQALERFGGSARMPEGAPAIICSVPGPYEAASMLGAADYLVKPVSRRALLATIQRLCPNAQSVLIVDDEPDAQRLFRRMLVSSGRGYRVLRATDGRQALSILRHDHPDIVLVDLIMPDMDGFQLLAAKNADSALRDIPSIIVSAQDPTGQPIVTSAVAVTRRGGLSVQQLLGAVEALSEIASPAKPTADRALPGTSGA